jgi:peptide/nickel transport system permease protein
VTQGTQAEMELTVKSPPEEQLLKPPATPLSPDPMAEEAAAGKGAASQWQLIRRRFARHKLAVASLYILALLYGLALLAEFVAPYGANRRNIDYGYCPPQLVRFNFAHGLHTLPLRCEVDPITFGRTYVELRDTPVPLSVLAAGDGYKLWGFIPLTRHLIGPDRADWDELRAAGKVPDGVQPTFFILGADKYGRDIFSRIVYGARVSLSVGLIGIFFTFMLGMTLGGISGYVGGRTDNLIQRGIEILNAFPHLPLWLALAAVLPTHWSALQIYFAITILLSLLNWTGLARVVRGKILSLREEDYAVAARLLGASHGRILFRHLMPGFTSHIIVALTLSIPGMILGETSLSFLGLGLRPPVVSWGVMLQDCMDVKAVSIYPWLLTPVTFIVATVLCFNFLGDGLRDAADPYSSR